jgi:hypothetical protein
MLSSVDVSGPEIQHHKRFFPEPKMRTLLGGMRGQFTFRQFAIIRHHLTFI